MATSDAEKNYSNLNENFLCIILHDLVTANVPDHKSYHHKLKLLGWVWCVGGGGGGCIATTH